MEQYKESMNIYEQLKGKGIIEVADILVNGVGYIY